MSYSQFKKLAVVHYDLLLLSCYLLFIYLMRVDWREIEKKRLEMNHKPFRRHTVVHASSGGIPLLNTNYKLMKQQDVYSKKNSKMKQRRASLSVDYSLNRKK